MKLVFFGTTDEDRQQIESLHFDTPVEFVYGSMFLNSSTVDETTGADAISIISNDCIDDEMAAALRKHGVRFITNRGTGVDHISKEALRKYGLECGNVPGYSPESISENTILLLLSLLRRMKRCQKMVRANNYKVDGIRGQVLRKMTVGVLGSGRIGSTTIQILSGFGCRILVNDVRENEAVRKTARYVSRKELFAKSDVVILHYPLLQDTFHVICQDTIAEMKDGAYLINTARGGLVDTPSVLDALKTGKLSGFAFDVYEGEDAVVRKDFQGQYPDDPVFKELCEMENVIYTPHISFFTDDAVREIMRISIQNAIDFSNTGHCRNSILR